MKHPKPITAFCVMTPKLLDAAYKDNGVLLETIKELEEQNRIMRGELEKILTGMVVIQRMQRSLG